MSTTTGSSFLKGTVVKIMAIASLPAGFLWLVIGLANVIEPGAYKTAQINAIYRKLGIPFQYPTESGIAVLPPLFTEGTFSDWATALETAGAYAINNVLEQKTQPYTREALATFATQSYSKHLIAGENESVAKIIARLTPFILLKNGVIAAGQASSSTIGISPTGTSTSTPKVFTGVLSQGVLGTTTPFSARPDDLITSTQDLQEAVANNLTPYLASLPSRITYEIKIVSSVTTRDGFTQRGQAQQVLSGYNKDGTARYRTVVNKFAVLNLYAITERNTKTKLSTIILGPTDAVQFRPDNNTLGAVESSVKSSVLTTDPGEISSVQLPTNSAANQGTQANTPTPTIVNTKDDAALQAEVARLTKIRDDLLKAQQQQVSAPAPAPVLKAYSYGAGNTSGVLQATSLEDAIRQASAYGEVKSINGVPLATARAQESSKPTVTPPVAAAPVATAPARAATCGASNLSEYFGIKGQSLPGISARSVMYEGFGLGQASFYAGTAEQNAKLLDALKRADGC